MKLSLIMGLLIFVNQHDVIDPFTLKENDNETLAIVGRNDFALQVPGLELLDMGSVDDFLTQVDQQIHKDPINATIDDAGRIIPEKAGYKVNRHTLRRYIFEYYYENGPATVKIPRISLYPKIDSELLSNIRTKRIGQFITYYNNHNQSRSHNIKIATEAINNQVLFPGETFSFNQVVGERTEEKGYMKALEIVKGEFTEGIGGGICQVSSTLFNAVDSSGMTILERYSHSRHVRYVPPGRDATVSWFGPDFTFKNEYKQPILIRARAFGGKVAVFIYSSEDLDYKPRNIYGFAPQK